MSSELACISTNFSTAARYSSGIQSSASTLPPDPTWAKKASASPASYAGRPFSGWIVSVRSMVAKGYCKTDARGDAR